MQQSRNRGATKPQQGCNKAGTFWQNELNETECFARRMQKLAFATPAYYGIEFPA
jgi:hypothetical protein